MVLGEDGCDPGHLGDTGLRDTVSMGLGTVYLLGSYRIATAPEAYSSRLTSFKSTCFGRPANKVGPTPASLGCTTNSYASINPGTLSEGTLGQPKRFFERWMRPNSGRWDTQAKFELVRRRVGCKDCRVIERILRVAHSFEEVEEFDRQDMARLSLEERVSAVEQLRRIWFGEAKAQSRLDRILVATNLEARSLRAGGGPRGGTVAARWSEVVGSWCLRCQGGAARCARLRPAPAPPPECQAAPHPDGGPATT